MKISHKNEAIERKNSSVCVVTEYPKIDEDIDFAIVKVTGRYPESKRAVNRVCKEIVYLHAGQGSVEVNGINYPLCTGDVVLIEAGEKFFWSGQMALFISCRPAFKFEQHQYID